MSPITPVDCRIITLVQSIGVHHRYVVSASCALADVRDDGYEIVTLPVELKLLWEGHLVVQFSHMTASVLETLQMHHKNVALRKDLQPLLHEATARRTDKVGNISE